MNVHDGCSAVEQPGDGFSVDCGICADGPIAIDLLQRHFGVLYFTADKVYAFHRKQRGASSQTNSGENRLLAPVVKKGLSAAAASE